MEAPEPGKRVGKKAGELGEEDVDIGEDMPSSHFPPVEIEKDTGNHSESSSSSSSSGSDSSSSSGTFVGATFQRSCLLLVHGPKRFFPGRILCCRFRLSKLSGERLGRRRCPVPGSWVDGALETLGKSAGKDARMTVKRDGIAVQSQQPCLAG